MLDCILWSVWCPWVSKYFQKSYWLILIKKKTVWFEKNSLDEIFEKCTLLFWTHFIFSKNSLFCVFVYFCSKVRSLNKRFSPKKMSSTHVFPKGMELQQKLVHFKNYSKTDCFCDKSNCCAPKMKLQCQNSLFFDICALHVQFLCTLSVQKLHMCVWIESSKKHF